MDTGVGLDLAVYKLSAEVVLGNGIQYLLGATGEPECLRVGEPELLLCAQGAFGNVLLERLLGDEGLLLGVAQSCSPAG